MTKNTRSIKIVFSVEGNIYEASVFLNMPTSIIVPDKNVVVTTTLSPAPDNSTKKDRYRKIINPTEAQEARQKRTKSSKSLRSVLDGTGRPNRLIFTKHSENEPFICNNRYISIATLR